MALVSAAAAFGLMGAPVTAQAGGLHHLCPTHWMGLMGHHHHHHAKAVVVKKKVVVKKAPAKKAPAKKAPAKKPMK